ncbi:hypothetical protein [Methylococcus sp. EFPC2]|uniref:hypothetical protein n=1 Tax=Methylococcus sp. EFPC2 TaxID=2812648 RepID=UPI0019673468|nr:hypothetical protein [Methylococcus sp. EFPC2]QSA97268.1 hypothetical protein JWZ97_19135 [Methylococcus sp. EFPC2]
MKKFNSILSASVLAVLSAGAHAAYDPSSTAFDLIVRVSGASAVDNALFDRVDLDLCQANANKSYVLQSGNSTASLGNYWGIACDATAASGVTGKVLFLKRSAGGSGVGVAPVNNSTPIQFVDRASCTDADANGVYTCPTLTVGDVPNGGVSDVAPVAFEAAINGGNGANLTGNLTAKEFAAQVFGIVVNTSFRNALQAAQFGSAHACVGSETEACMPSLSKQEINSIFSAGTTLTSWGSFRVNRDGLAGTNGESLTASPSTAAYRTAPFDTKLHICRRVVGSGTQAQFNANFLDNPSKGGSALTPYSQGDTNFLTGPIVWNGSGSGDVETCLEAYDSGTTKTITSATGSTQINPASGETGPTKAWAIGIQGTEKNNTLAKAYRFIKIDGVAPTLQNVWNGKYFDFAESSFQVRTGDTSGEATFVKNAFNLTAASIAKLNLGTDLAYTPGGTGAGEHQWGVGGYLLPSTITGASPDGAKFVLTNPVTNYTRFNNYAASPVANPTFKSRTPFTSGDSSLNTNGSLNAAGTGLTVIPGVSSW